MLRLALPVVLAELGWMAMGIVDTIMVAPLGPSAIAAAGIGTSVHMAFAVFAAWLLRELGTIWTLAALLFAVAVAWSRLALRRHEPRDLVAGAIAGTLAGAAFWPLAARWMP